MTCKKCSKQLMSLVHNELDESARPAVEEHLSSCSACADELVQLRATLQLLDAQPGLAPSTGFDAGFRQKLAEANQQDQARNQRKVAWWRLPALAAGAVGVCAVVVGLAVTRVSGPPLSTPRRPASDLELIQNVELLRDYDLVDNLDGLENYDVVMNLDELLQQQEGQR